MCLQFRRVLFRSRAITQLGCSEEAAAFLMAAGFPTDRDSFDYLETCRAPKIFIQSTNDQFGPRDQMEQAYAKFAEPKRLIWVEAADHFFSGGLEQLEEAVREAAVA